MCCSQHSKNLDCTAYLNHALQIPWGRWRGGALVVELSDVLLTVSSREETDWEEGPALRRAQAAKQAQLAAAELAKLGSRVAATGSSSAAGASQQQQHVEQAAAAAAAAGVAAAAGSGGSSSSSWAWSILDYIMSFLLNRLHIEVKNVHVSFQVGILKSSLRWKQYVHPAAAATAEDARRHDKHVAEAPAAQCLAALHSRVPMCHTHMHPSMCFPAAAAAAAAAASPAGTCRQCQRVRSLRSAACQPHNSQARQAARSASCVCRPAQTSRALGSQGGAAAARSRLELLLETSEISVAPAAAAAAAVEGSGGWRCCCCKWQPGAVWCACVGSYGLSVGACGSCYGDHRTQQQQQQRWRVSSSSRVRHQQQQQQRQQRWLIL
jgi:hypothetical protein